MSSKQTIKLSFSILNAWTQGQYEQATAYYLGKDFPTTPQMELGSLKHKEWEAEVKRTKCLPVELGGEPLNNPITERKYEKLIPFSEEYQILLRGVIDLRDGDKIYDYKVGLTEPSYYLNGFQAETYQVLLPSTKIAEYRCFNPYTKQTKIGVKYLSEQSFDNGLNFILSNAGEMVNYLVSQKLVRDYQWRG